MGKFGHTLCALILVLSLIGNARCADGDEEQPEEDKCWDTWSEWSDCQVNVCGPKTRTHSRSCICNGNDKDEFCSGQDSQTETDFCVDNCVRSLDFWTVHSSVAPPPFDIPWPFGKELRTFPCSESTADYIDDDFTWIESLRVEATNIWLELAQQFVVALNNINAGAKDPVYPDDDHNDPVDDAFGLLQNCKGKFKGKDKDLVVYLIELLDKYNSGQTDVPLCTSDVPCCTWSESQWNSWSDCSAPCGKGTKYRERACICPGYPTLGTCNNAPAPNETKSCNEKACEKEDKKSCVWTSDWSSWSECAERCSGTRVRSSLCSCGSSALCTSNDGIKSEEDDCWDDAECIADPTTPVENAAAAWELCEWGDWNLGKGCSKACGGGIALRSRECQCETSDGKIRNSDVKKCNTTPAMSGEITGASYQVSCNEQPCVSCDRNLSVYSGGTKYTDYTLRTTRKYAVLTFSGLKPVNGVSVYLDTQVPHDSDNDLAWNYNIKFTKSIGKFDIKIPLYSSESNSTGAYCGKSFFIVVKVTTENGGVAWGTGDYAFKDYGSVVECMNSCDANATADVGNIASVEFQSGIVQPVAASDALISGDKTENGMGDNPLSTLWVLYVVLPCAVFVIAVIISVIVLRVKFNNLPIGAIPGNTVQPIINIQYNNDDNDNDNNM